MNKTKHEEIKKILASLEVILAANINDEGAPVKYGDISPEEMNQLITDHTSLIRGCYACIKSMGDDMYAHINNSMHPDNYKNWDHKDYANRQLGFGKEAEVRRVAYSSDKSKKVVIG